MEDYKGTTLDDGFISPTRLVVPNPIVRRYNALPRGSLGPNTQQLHGLHTPRFVGKNL